MASTFRNGPFLSVALFGGVAACCFIAAMATFPGGGYNPLAQMLSMLGRMTVKGVEGPLCHYLFVVGMFSSALAALAALFAQRLLVAGARRRILVCGAALNAVGLITIALAPEDVCMFFHNAGCWAAALGGGMALLALDRHATGRAWTVALVAVVAIFCVVIAFHALGVIPFSPAVPTLQKTLILSFAAWILRLVWPVGTRLSRVLASCVGVATLVVATVNTVIAESSSTPFAIAPEAKSDQRKPLEADELSALRWLDHVTGELPSNEEKDWWAIGGTQHGLFAKRYNIAFCGYAAAALGMRGGDAERKTAGRILGNCVNRYLKRDNWAYAMGKTYWGEKPWAPDPCYRENVMYTGHLLQLLALYEWFTADTRYWADGFDFVWKDGRKVHYTVQKLVDVTLWQMRKGPNGGVCCEPGLMFFPCNNHPHVALRLFSKLGHGDWTTDARRWEKWALAHYRNPLFGGGALNLVYHVKSGLFYPRGHSGLDGWSLLWYEPWAANRADAIALWREAVGKIDFAALENAPDARRGVDTCCDPVDVPSVATTTFLAAAARACDDPDTAARLEKIADRHLVRKDGMMWLDVGRDWRVGATANRIIALAYANGSSFRDFLTVPR